VRRKLWNPAPFWIPNVAAIPQEISGTAQRLTMNCPQMPKALKPFGVWTPSAWACILAGLAAIAMAPVAGVGQTPSQPQDSHLRAAAIFAPAPKPQAPSQAQQAISQQAVTDGAPASAQPANPVVLQTAALLKLATDLKAEMDKTTRDMLSVGVVRKAGEIERLAHQVRNR
jgi:hypothetical protein